jgi:hypothetical protein
MSFAWSAKANVREPKSCLGRVFHLRLGSFADMKKVQVAHARPSVKLKTLPRFCPPSLSFKRVDEPAAGNL